MDESFKNAQVTAGAAFAASDRSGPAAHFGDSRAEYRALTAAAGLVDFAERTQIELAGSDRQSFLHNLCTNDIRRLTPGSGCEAFFCNAQGHTLALAFVFCGADTLVIETVPGQEEKLLAHLDRYLIREKVELRPRSHDWAELLLAGAGSSELLRSVVSELPQGSYDHRAARIEDVDVSLRRVDITLPVGYLISCSRAAVAAVWEGLLGRGARPCGAEAVEAARIEAGTPYFGRDISDANLPQEVARDQRAISFNKGCYIGQETVARLDSLGHVNRTLAGVRFSGDDVPAAGTELVAEGGKVVGQVTSAAFSPRLAAPLALGYLRKGCTSPGTRFESALGAGEVVALPVAS